MSHTLAETTQHLDEVIAELRSADNELVAIGKTEAKLRTELANLGSQRAHIFHKRNLILARYADLKARSTEAHENV